MKHNRDYLKAFALFALTLVLYSNPAFAAATVGDVAENITTSARGIPGLITGLSFLFALLLGVTGILKLRDHVENPAQTPLRVPIIRFFAGGALLALPIVFEAARNSIGALGLFGLDPAMYNSTNNVAYVAGGVNDVLGNIIGSLSTVPGIVTAMAYLLGVIACVVGILKIRDHVENQEQTPIREGVVRLLLGGALFSIPTIYEAVETTITGGAGSVGGTLATILPTAANYLTSTQADAVNSCGGLAVTGGVGESICYFIQTTGATPAFLVSISYIFGLVIGVWALLKIRDHVLNPQQTSVWEGVSRLIVAGAFFSMPFLAGVFQNALTGGNAFFTGTQNTGFNSTATCGGGGPLPLDEVVMCFMQDIMAPAHVLFSHFAFIAGLVFIMIGISRIMKSAQEGARGPGGMGTIMTFITAGVLISYNVIIDFFTTTLSMGGGNTTNATLSYTTGMTAAEVQHADNIVAAILQFMIIVGLISFIRGWFIIRDVAEGNQQASLMAGATHIIGGAVAINLGPLLAAVQQTLNITAIGLTFS
ncbi:MAG: hypothetical protein ACLFR0_05605 [Alphaproteobacteria bacterium]